ncbi:MAG TPA: hypothetical protein VKF32_01285, partial [Thermoanaerobaculia bacterium]|nr:hypothetical protein [Thermoanaerobaculia bacterium]
MRRLAVGALVAGFCVVTSGRALSQPFPRKDVPPALGPWVPWALDGADEKLCPAVKGAAVCLWPGRLTLTLAASGGTFRQELTADRALHASLPGGARSWPQDVTLDGRAAAVLTRDGRPAVWIEAGSHRLEGRFVWSRMPDSLAVPPHAALLELSVAGQAVAFPRREDDGLLILRQGAGESGKEEELRVKVFRRLTDGIPLWLETKIQLEVSGRAREVRLGGALTPHALPIAVRGELPARLDADGALRVQVRPGRFTVDVLCRLDGNPAKVERRPGAPPWPSQEIWVFAANEKMRQVEVSGATPIDPARTDLPEAWRPLPAFVLDAGGALTLREARRGEPDASPDRISLARTLWLDLDGRGFSVRDRFAGSLGRTTRLDLARPGELGRVAVDGRDQLVTANPASAVPGVELRKASLDLLADSRLPRAAALPAVGWNANVQSLRVALELPPGWSLLAARGVDRAPTAWLSRWTLFGFFLVVLVAAAVAKLAGWRFGLVALATLALCYREPGAPELVWVSLLASGALLAVTRGRLLTLVKVWWALSALALVLIALPFFLREVRGGLFPQTRGGAAFGEQAGYEGDIDTFAVGGLGVAKKAAVAPQVEEVQAPASPAPRREAKVASPQESSSVAELQQLNVFSFSKAKQETYEQDPHAVIQTGPGVPAWRWRTAPLEWSGPVAKEQPIRLLLLSPAMNLVLALLRVALVTLLGARLLARERQRFPVPFGSRPIAPLALLLVLGAGTARAQQVVPSDEVLGELRDRLTRPFPCAPGCVETPSASVTLKGGELAVAAEVHAGAPAGWAIPGPASEWVPRSVAVDRAPAAMARLA